MIEIQVPKDITTYKTKTVGPLTMRQLVILMLVIAMDFLLSTAVLKDRNQDHPSNGWFALGL